LKNDVNVPSKSKVISKKNLKKKKFIDVLKVTDEDPDPDLHLLVSSQRYRSADPDPDPYQNCMKPQQSFFTI
jgi:hypothetical protein